MFAFPSESEQKDDGNDGGDGKGTADRPPDGPAPPVILKVVSDLADQPASSSASFQKSPPPTSKSAPEQLSVKDQKDKEAAERRESLWM